MPSPVSSIPNLGPASEAAFAKAGITTAEEIRDMGADAAYRALLAAGTLPHFIGYYVLHMGLQGRPWNDCQGDEKKALRARFDAIKAGNGGTARSELEQALQLFGVVEKPQRASGSFKISITNSANIELAQANHSRVNRDGSSL